MKKLLMNGLMMSLALFIAAQPATAAGAKPAANKPYAEQAVRLNLNTASVEQLTQLKGIGKAKAEAIVEYRNTIGQFQTVEQLEDVKGIGKKMVEKLKSQVTV
ncbi:helix-hairpin-helix domain-containing protein [Alteromonas sp. ASW11-36]|uniref:Helix-hairpin-helix domain-containing protein n=1 Tax=Alteromonas arenosi TaxID=3055817 RepID=A0ABT7SXG2_9ALTE|nr:helix-hairpin-helix domain-containing protein [Alteromonas sp. ASW11-36]MDM7860234.1 helix-hairpin-helix domain-containing protein [Alteromonas sp. ASW11-36]